MLYLPDKGLFIFILFNLPTDSRYYESGPSILNFRMSYGINKSQLGNVSETCIRILSEFNLRRTNCIL